jgi:hypothetical protein
MSPARLTKPNPTTVRHGDQPAFGRLAPSPCCLKPILHAFANEVPATMSATRE